MSAQSQNLSGKLLPPDGKSQKPRSSPRRASWLFMASIGALLMSGVLLCYPRIALSTFARWTTLIEAPTPACPGYALDFLAYTPSGLVAQLRLAGPPCNAFGTDIPDLRIDVLYETQTRLRVHIYDRAGAQFTLPSKYFPRPQDSTFSQAVPDLEFNYESQPFAFWITRREGGDIIFDTRGSNLVFEDQYLQLTSVLPKNANIYGLGEAVARAGFRRAIEGEGTMQTMWARDAADPEDENMYGSHAVYLEHRVDAAANTSAAHGVFLSNAAGADILLHSSNDASVVEYRVLGGTLDFYFFAGSRPNDVIEQYGALVGLPAWMPYWAFGFHLCRWGYVDLADTRAQVRNMQEANIPLEVMWNDIELYHDRRDFTTDPVNYPAEEMREFIRELVANGQYYIPIVDAAIPHVANDSDMYLPFLAGVERDTFITNPDGSLYIGQVWPGYTVFPDWFGAQTEAWWAETLTNWTASGMEFSGLWLDMNEPSSFCDGSCGTGADLSNTSAAVLFPGDPGAEVTDWPEGYNASIWGTSGNMTINGTLTYGNNSVGVTARAPWERKRDIEVNNPPYAIHNGAGHLSINTVAPNATHMGGLREYDVHNLYGYMQERATHLALLQTQPDSRPFLISRGTFPSTGHWSGHWLGDNFSKWSYLRYNIQGVLQFQLFQIPMVGADTCGFNGNTDEELCNRWMQLSAFTPFYRNHNERGAISQEPYRWDSVAQASKTAMAVRYAMLPYWYTLFANASLKGTPPVRALFWEFPDEEELLSVDLQFMIGSDILVTPVVSPNASTVDGIFPGRGTVEWRDWYTHKIVDTIAGKPTTLAAPLGHIPVHIRAGAALLLHSTPGYTTRETRASPYALMVALDAGRSAFGTAYLDDGETNGGPSRTVQFRVADEMLYVKGEGAFAVRQTVQKITILGVMVVPSRVWVGEGGAVPLEFEYDAMIQRLVVSGLEVDLNRDATVRWQ